MANHTLQYGDVIKITLKDEFWALYVGKGEIVHLVLIGEESGTISADAVRKFMLKKDLLSNVAGNSNYLVENKYDHSLHPREKKAIERSVHLWLNNGITFKIMGIFEQESEKIIQTLRYDTGKMSTDASPGDLIEIPVGLYSHWVVYVGHGYIVHLVNEVNSLLDLSSAATLPARSSGSSSASGGTGYVWKDRLSEYVSDKNYKVNNKYDKKYPPRNVEDIIKIANAKAWKDHKYDLIEMNCEHFATQLRYRIPVSGQVSDAALHTFYLLWPNMFPPFINAMIDSAHKCSYMSTSDFHLI
ncbi:hypothetical protein AOXY_G31599 [Acipenser oxyrinchus oxyrinchus]|uniref:LRAT domain-containing protein n=1 Tax=Acipenser oxyrinchus oxyrinchus TaxID=40147 RepID=A0AAD8FQP4_ACIOX|nr:hypothetical protein AOXY_G31599 [Acipenser oxyrinchus oxyrinchus]